MGVETIKYAPVGKYIRIDNLHIKQRLVKISHHKEKQVQRLFPELKDQDAFECFCDDTLWLINRLYKKELEALGIDRWSGSFRVNKAYSIFGKTLIVDRVLAVLNEPVEL